MNDARVLVLVNGPRDGALGVRARGLFELLRPRLQPTYLYREGGRLGAFRRFLAALLVGRPDLTYVVDAGIAGAGAAVCARLVRGTRFVLDTGDLAYELAKSKGSPSWPARQVVRVVEHMALRLATAVVVRGSYHRELLERTGLRSVHLVRDGIGTTPASEAEVQRLRQQLDLDDALCVGVVGSLRWNRRSRLCYGWDLVDALALIDGSLPVCAVVVGDGDGLQALQRRAQELGVAGRVRFVGRVRYADLSSYLSILDVALSTQTNDDVGRVRTTGKLPEYMAAGCFVLATDVGEARLLLPAEMRLPYEGAIDREYPKRLAERITELARMERDRLRGATAATVARAQAELDYSVLSAQLDQVLARVLEQERAEARGRAFGGQT